MSNFKHRRRKDTGLPPGTLVYTGESRQEKIRITVIDYNKDQFQQKEVSSVDECFPFKNTPTITWINVDGVHDLKVLETLGQHYDLHPLILEDIANVGQRPKMEDMDDYIYLISRMLAFNEKDMELVSEQMSIIIGSNFIISFQETEGDIFDSIRERIKQNRGKIREHGPDYLAYSLIDSIVDNYYVILEIISEDVELLEDELLSQPDIDTLKEIQHLKAQLMFLRKSVWPLREVAARMERSRSELIRETTEIYLRDTYDHTVQIIDSLESLREMLGSMLEIYLSSISNRLSEVMKVLTVISTIFMPITFIASLYGMNFRHMPELNWSWSYPAVLILMLVISLTMLRYFRKRKWI